MRHSTAAPALFRALIDCLSWITMFFSVSSSPRRVCASNSNRAVSSEWFWASFSNLVVSCALVSVAAWRRILRSCTPALYWLCSSFSCCILAIWPLVIFAFSARRKSIDESSLLYNAALVAFLALPLARFLDDGIWQSISSLLTLNSQIIVRGGERGALPRLLLTFHHACQLVKEVDKGFFSLNRRWIPPRWLIVVFVILSSPLSQKQNLGIASATRCLCDTQESPLSYPIHSVCIQTIRGR